MIVVPGQQRHQGGQRGQEPDRDRTQPSDVTEGEGPQERAQRGRCLHPGEHLVHGALTQHPETGDAVRAGEHPRDHAANLRGCVAPGRVTLAVTRAPNPARRAGRITGTSPPEPIRLVSSKVAAVFGLWDCCISRMACAAHRSSPIKA
jgi:hypothetical protein